MSRTLLEIRTQIKDDLDLNEETFVDDSDLDRWINDAIEMAEAEIHSLYEDYFLDSVTVPIARNDNTVDYPSNIYGNKIRKIIYRESLTDFNSVSHEVMREKDIIRAEALDIYNTDTQNPILRWVPINSATTGRTIRLYPKTSRDGFLVIYYIRNANRLSLDTDVCDIDEYSRYIIQAVKTQVFLKDGDPRTQESKVLEDQLKGEMIESLSNMTPDNNDEIELDMSHYDDMVGGYYRDYGDH